MELAGSGAVYIRLTKNPCTLTDSSSDELVSYLGSPVSSRTQVTSDPVIPREPVTPTPDTPREPVIPTSVTPREPVILAPITPREPVIPAPITPGEPVVSASSSLFVDNTVASDNDASIYCIDDLSSSPTVGDSVIILDNDHSNSPLDDFGGDGMKVVGKSDLTRLAEMFPHMTSQQLQTF